MMMRIMYTQSLLLSLLIILVSFSLCFGSYMMDETYHQTTSYQHYNGRFMKPKHDHLGIMTSSSPQPSPSSRIVNVDHYGAKSKDGKDDNEAFEKSWKESCSKGGVLMVPRKKIYHLKPITFSGPCHPNTSFKIHGTIKAWPRMSAYERDSRLWIVFENVTNLKVEGGGTINGNGKIWWQNSCKINESLPCKHAPTAVTFNECTNLRVENLRFKNAQQMHIRFQRCNNVWASNLKVKAPGNSPNTDGIHVTGTQNIDISNSVIRTGDDCISIVSGSQNVRATDIICGPGHGISIGSLGKGNSEAEVSNVVVNRATLTGTTNGVRIKTWQGGSGFARNIKFMNIAMRNVTNPIIIDQNYCDQKGECPEQKSAVQLSNVVYKNIKGTSASEVAIKFECSKSMPCEGIHLQDVILRPQGNGNTIATCDNIGYSKRGNFYPHCQS